MCCAHVLMLLGSYRHHRPALPDPAHRQALLSAQPDTRQTLADLALQKHLFTNADAKHAAACLSRMGLADCFEVRCAGGAGFLHATSQAWTVLQLATRTNLHS